MNSKQETQEVALQILRSLLIARPEVSQSELCAEAFELAETFLSVGFQKRVQLASYKVLLRQLLRLQELRQMTQRSAQDQEEFLRLEAELWPEARILANAT